MATAAATTDTGTALTASYTYTDDLLTKLQTGSTTYNFGYGSFDLRSSITIGSRTLASYSYTNRTHYLSALDYGNGDSVDYTYDQQGRVTKETYEDGDTVTYKYDNSGALATITDSATGRTTAYYYDFTDRMMKYVESGSGYHHSVGYTYDNINNLTALAETINGVTRTTNYTYDDDNRIASVNTNGISESYAYDGYGRVTTKVTKNGGATVLTETYTYRVVSGKQTGQVATMRSVSGGRDVTYTYEYDSNGNIVSVDDGTNKTTYVYDSANQLVREDNPAAGMTWTWTYDDAGNILSKRRYAYTTGSLGSVLGSLSYSYADSAWGDLLTYWNAESFSYDAIGNLTSDGIWSYTWEHGRELASMSNGSTTWSFTYDANGMRTARSNGSRTYSYVYNGSSLSQLTVDGHTMRFTYDASGSPLSVTYDGTEYYYALNLQGDVVAILNGSGTAVVQYAYEAWGGMVSTDGSQKDTLGFYNPLRYRGYVYDAETTHYYLQSRYYYPYLCRFINADAFTSTGQGLLGNNMFAYCGNNPVNYYDPAGNFAVGMLGEPLAELGEQIGKWIYNTFKHRKDEIEEKKRKNSEVKFEPNAECGGRVVNSYTITDWDEIYEYSSNLKEAYPSSFKGSVEGMAVEWVVHNVACYIPFFELDKAKDVDLGSTIFDDTHPVMNMAMWMLYYITHPYQCRSDLWIHFD